MSVQKKTSQKLKAVRTRKTKAFREVAFQKADGKCSYCSTGVNPFTAFKTLGDKNGVVYILCDSCGKICGTTSSWPAFESKIVSRIEKATALLERYPAR